MTQSEHKYKQYQFEKGVILILQDTFITEIRADAIVYPKTCTYTYKIPSIENYKDLGALTRSFLLHGGESLFQNIQEAEKSRVKTIQKGFYTGVKYLANNEAFAVSPGLLEGQNKYLIVTSVDQSNPNKPEIVDQIYGNRDTLRKATKNALNLAENLRIESIMFPSMRSSILVENTNTDGVMLETFYEHLTDEKNKFVKTIGIAACTTTLADMGGGRYKRVVDDANKLFSNKAKSYEGILNGIEERDLPLGAREIEILKYFKPTNGFQFN